MMNLSNFAALLKQKRTALHLSQSKVAQLCYMSKSSYSHFENGKRLPSLETMLKLCKILNTDLEEFIGVLYSNDAKEENHESPGFLRENESVDSVYQSSFIATFNLLDQQGQKAIVDIIDSMLEEDKDTPK